MEQYLSDHPTAFDPKTISILTGALSDAWQVVVANEAVFKIDGHADDARRLLARHIVDLAMQGERDSYRLSEGALVRLKL
jgi:hypothetical protein